MVSDKNIFVSATITDFNVFCESIGLPKSPEKTLGINVDESPFAMENRLIHHTPVGFLNRNQIDENLPKLAEKIEEIIRLNHEGQRGIILPYTHRIKEYLFNYLNDKFPGRILTHGRENDSIEDCPYCHHYFDPQIQTDDKGRVICVECGKRFFKYQRDAVLDRFETQLDMPYILISTYINEGFDFKDDIARFAIVCKVPYPNLGSNGVKKRILFEQDTFRKKTGYTCNYKGVEEATMVGGEQTLLTKEMCSNWGCEACRAWYNMKAASAIIQMTGRVVRNQKDWATIYIMDTSFKRFYNAHKYLFPKYIRESIRWWDK
jgi:Rad3-related DNA helicase